MNLVEGIAQTAAVLELRPILGARQEIRRGNLTNAKAPYPDKIIAGSPDRRIALTNMLSSVRLRLVALLPVLVTFRAGLILGIPADTSARFPRFTCRSDDPLRFLELCKPSHHDHGATASRSPDEIGFYNPSGQQEVYNGARCPVPGARCPVPGARCPVPLLRVRGTHVSNSYVRILWVGRCACWSLLRVSACGGAFAAQFCAGAAASHGDTHRAGGHRTCRRRRKHHLHGHRNARFHAHRGDGHQAVFRRRGQVNRLQGCVGAGYHRRCWQHDGNGQSDACGGGRQLLRGGRNP